MFKRTFFTLGALLIALVLVSSAAADGPPWPAEVHIREDGACFMWWLDSSLQFIPVFGTWTGEYQAQNGVANEHCRIDLDFDDPNIATIEQMCTVFPGDHCHGNGSIVMRDWECSGIYGLVSTSSILTVNSSGNLNVECHFRGD
jgi:hypothetical protein